MAPIREKPHRLLKEFYRGRAIVAFTLCLKDRATIFRNPIIIDIFLEFLTETADKNKCKIPVYCFMPDHLHLIITGTDNEVDLLTAVSSFKQKTGFWLSKNTLGVKWQKDFFDHVIKKDESLATNVKYILDNPVRRGLVTEWQKYPFIGSIGYKLEDILIGIM